jgi:hypothetical protein
MPVELQQHHATLLAAVSIQAYDLGWLPSVEGEDPTVAGKIHNSTAACRRNCMRWQNRLENSVHVCHVAAGEASCGPHVGAARQC